MCEDRDIKIFDSNHSANVQNTKAHPVNDPIRTAAGKELGKSVAAEYIKAGKNSFADDEKADSFMIMQRMLLLSFTVTVGFEKYCGDDAVSGIAQKAFLDTLRRDAPEFFAYSSDTGAFSFYFLAYRRGADVVRRIGQTFAMLCSHDGDPIYQELGETLYCWFSSVIERNASKLAL